MLMCTTYKIYSPSKFDRGFTLLMPLRVYGHIKPDIQFKLQHQSTTYTPAKPKQLLLFSFNLPHLLHAPMRDSPCLLYEPLSTWHTIPFTSPDLSSSLCLACSREGHKSPLTAGQTPWEQKVERKSEGHIQARSQIVSWAWLFSLMLWNDAIESLCKIKLSTSLGQQWCVLTLVFTNSSEASWGRVWPHQIIKCFNCKLDNKLGFNTLYSSFRVWAVFRFDWYLLQNWRRGLSWATPVPFPPLISLCRHSV